MNSDLTAFGPVTWVHFEDGHVFREVTLLGLKGTRTPMLWRPYTPREVEERCRAFAGLMDALDAMSFDVLGPGPTLGPPGPTPVPAGLASERGARGA